MTDLETDRVRIDRETLDGTAASDGPVARIRLTDPDRRNALSTPVCEGLVTAVRALEGTDVRCAVLVGDGPAFCAGGDIDAMVERAESPPSGDDSVRRVIRTIGRAVRVVHECEFPTVAAIDGPAVGAGAALALACDVQVASTTASIGFSFRRVGLAADSGTSYLLPRIVGANTAAELLYTGDLLDANEAAELGLVNRVCPAGEFEERLGDFVERIAAGPTVALRTSKRLLRREFDSIGEAIEAEAAAQAAVYDSDDHEEGVAAFLDGRDPEFTGQ